MKKSANNGPRGCGGKIRVGRPYRGIVLTGWAMAPAPNCVVQ